MADSRTLSVAAFTLVLAGAAPARADFPNPAIYIGVFGGAHLVLRDFDLGANAHQAGASNLPVGPNPVPGNKDALLPGHSGLLGARLGVQIAPQFAIEGEFAYLPMKSNAGTNNNVLAWDVNLLIHILRRNWTPVIELGAGAYHMLSGGDLGSDSDVRFHAGLGLRGMLTDWLALRVDVRDVFADGFDFWQANNLEIMAGLDFFAWRASGYQDSDGDGIRDSEDKCPKVAGPAERQGCPASDRDGDGVVDEADLCPDVAAGPHPDPKRAGCPADRDGDGVLDIDDQCPDVSAGRLPDPARAGCPADRDGDGVIDENDLCPEVPAGAHPDPSRPGCPGDRDGDGVTDAEDQCPDVPTGKYPDPKRPGCPADSDGDGVIDEQDLCSDTPAGKMPDPKRPGCPSDRDNDTVPDEVDACPDKPGAPDPDPKKNGCPGLVEVKGGQIVIFEQVYFATGKDSILPKSFPVLTAVANAIKSMPPTRRIRIEGHTDNRGDPKKNRALSQRRAEAVEKWLGQHGVDPERVDPKGYGQERPLANNKTEAGRAKNRRVEFHVETEGTSK